MEHYWKKIKRVSEITGEWINQSTENGDNFLIWMGSMSYMAPMTLHKGVFKTSMAFLGNEE